MFTDLPKGQLEFDILVRILIYTVLDSLWRFGNSS